MLQEEGSQINIRMILTVLGIIFLSSMSYPQEPFPENEDGPFEDMLTPEYYLSDSGDVFRSELNKLVYYARTIEFQNPLMVTNGDLPLYEITRNFGDGIGGPTGTSQHHPAIDMHIENNETAVTLLAAHDGYVRTYVDAPKYRHYLSITKEVLDASASVIGKIVTLYGHIDLDLDSTAGLVMGGQYVERGDTVSMNLYSETVGGPHLHFEIRLYRPGDVGDELFYSFVGPEGSETYTEQSVGSWSYGYWNPSVAYGFANPENHMLSTPAFIANNDPLVIENFSLSQNYPNPFNPVTSITYTLLASQTINLEVYDIRGSKIIVLEEGYQQKGSHITCFDGTNLPSGLYIYQLNSAAFSIARKMVLTR